MRISFFVPRCTPDNSHGRYVIELAKRLGVEHLVTVNAGAFWPPLRSLARCRFLPVPNRPVVARLAALWTASVFNAKRRLGDIVHVQGADAPVGNVVTAQYCCAVLKGGAGYGAGLVRGFNDAIGAVAEKYTMSKASTQRIIAISQQVKGDVEREYGVDPRRIVVIPHGVDLEAFHPNHRGLWRAKVRERLGIGCHEFVALFVGGDYRRKGLLVLLKAAAHLRAPAKVLAVGVKLDRELAEFVHHNGLSALVTFHSSTPDLAPFYAAADCFALPTRYDTFSMATLEAMASGLPVIVSRKAGVTELVTPGQDCLVLEDPDNTVVLAGQLERLIQDEALRRTLGVEARKTAEGNSWDRVVEQTLQVYREVLASSPSAAAVAPL